MHNKFYRFRNLKSLFEFEELANQEIYFAHPEQLNDPMEGYRDIFWSGDKIVWMNLLKHYILCLERVCSLLIIGGEQHGSINEDSIPVFAGFDDFPTPMYKDMFEVISSDFFSICDKMVEKIASRTTPVYRDELYLYLNIIHPLAIRTIQNNYEQFGLVSKQEVAKFDYGYDAIKTICDLVDALELDISMHGHNNVNIIFDVAKSVSSEIALINKLANSNAIQNTPNRNFVMIDFPKKYINSLERLMYSKWYTACFVAEEGTHNSSVWGHYGDGHRGICLIFDTQNGFINLYGKNGFSWSRQETKSRPSFGNRSHKFYKINYQSGFESVDFWKSLGRLPIGKLRSTWYYSEDKTNDVASKYLSNDEEKWRENHWNIFYRDIVTKTEDWKYESEYRLILTDLLDDEIAESHRKLKYDFKSLRGLIFGIQTPEKDKIKIIEIIKQKCDEHDRMDFEFYEAYYSHKDKNIQHRKLNLLKFNKSQSIK